MRPEIIDYIHCDDTLVGFSRVHEVPGSNNVSVQFYALHGANEWRLNLVRSPKTDSSLVYDKKTTI